MENRLKTVHSIEQLAYCLAGVGAVALPLLLLVGLIGAIWYVLRINGSLNRTGRPSTGGRPRSQLLQVTIKYRTEDGAEDYKFRTKEIVKGMFNVYILEQPSYNGRGEDSHATHRLHDSSGTYICWSTPITTYKRAQEIAKMWAEATEQYRKTGKRF